MFYSLLGTTPIEDLKFLLYISDKLYVGATYDSNEKIKPNIIGTGTLIR